MTKEEFIVKEQVRIRRRHQAKHNEMGDRETFANWYIEQLLKQNLECFYCSTSIIDINLLIDRGKLKVRNVRGDGVRGRVLEIDKMENEKGYCADNCVLACYYCNNDKSYTLDSKTYKEHFGFNRHRYHQLLLSKIKPLTANG